MIWIRSLKNGINGFVICTTIYTPSCYLQIFHIQTGLFSFLSSLVRSRAIYRTLRNYPIKFLIFMKGDMSIEIACLNDLTPAECCAYHRDNLGYLVKRVEMLDDNEIVFDFFYVHSMFNSVSTDGCRARLHNMAFTRRGHDASRQRLGQRHRLCPRRESFSGCE